MAQPVAPQGQVPPVLVNIPPAPVVFARSPGEYVDPAGPQFINWASEREVKAYKTAIKGLEDKFDLSPLKLQSFMNRVQERATMFNWQEILDIILPVPAAVPGMPLPQAPQPINLITNYGQVTLAQVQAHAGVYMAIEGRLNQQSGMLYSFLSNSIDIKAHNILDITPQSYTVNGRKDGVCFLKELITKAYVDTNATVDNIRKSIAKLDEKIKELKFDIKAFNAYVLTQVNAMNAHGVQCPELLTNLFTAYGQVQDPEFEQHVRMYYFQYTNASLRGQEQDLTREMMLAMEQNYHRRVENGTWNPKQLKTDKERIIALETTITELKAVNSGTSPSGNNNNQNDTSSNRTISRNQAQWAWKKVPPKPGKPHSIKKNKKDYHWCPHHKQWCIHTPSECTLKDSVANETTVEETTVLTPEPTPAINDPVLQSLVGGRGRFFA